MVPTFTPVFNSGRLLLSFCLFCHNTTSLCFSTPPAGGSLKSIACGRPYLINVYPELLQHFNEPGSFWCRVSLPIVYSGLMVVFGTQIETGGKECPERLGRVSNFSSLTCSVFRYLADRRHCLKLLPWYGIPFSSGSAVLVFLWNVLAGKIFSLSIAWTADVAWKCLKAVLETQQSPGECPARLWCVGVGGSCSAHEVAPSWPAAQLWAPSGEALITGLAGNEAPQLDHPVRLVRLCWI